MLLTNEGKELILYNNEACSRSILTKSGSISSDLSAFGSGLCSSKDKLPHAEKNESYKERLKKAEACGADVLSLRDSRYPSRLKEIADPPPYYYAKGAFSLEGKKCVAISGSRDASSKGKRLAGRIARELAKEGVVVIAGLARGIETAAHIGALHSGRSACVLPCGLGRVYPPENRRLKESLFSKGRVVSEYEANVPAKREHFPQRNRMIIGLSVALVVIECGRSCSALYMADTALEENREVLSVPGEAYCENWEGSNRLIQQGAKLVHDAKDILDEI